MKYITYKHIFYYTFINYNRKNLYNIGPGAQRPALPPHEEHRSPRSQAGKLVARHHRQDRPPHRLRLGPRDPAEISGKLDRFQNRSESGISGAGSHFERPRRHLHRHVVLRSLVIRVAEV
jgi:hypothetical protein